MTEMKNYKTVNEINGVELINEKQFNEFINNNPDHGLICNKQDHKFKFIYSNVDESEMYIVDFLLKTCNPCTILNGKLYVNIDIERFPDLNENWYDEILIDDKSYSMKQMLTRSEYDNMNLQK